MGRDTPERLQEDRGPGGDAMTLRRQVFGMRGDETRVRRFRRRGGGGCGSGGGARRRRRLWTGRRGWGWVGGKGGEEDE